MYVRYEQSLVDAALSHAAEGWSAERIAERLGVAPSTVRRWISAGGVRKTGPGCSTAECRAGGPPDPAAYAYLLGMYLGDGHITRVRTTYRLQVSCDARYPAIIEATAASAATTLPRNAVGMRMRGSIVLIDVYSNHLPCLFLQHGPGPKHLRPITLAPWQRGVAIDTTPEAFVRGLIHSDGWRGINRVRNRTGRSYEYPRYMFSNRSEDIRALFIEACAALGVVAVQAGRWNVSVAAADGVARLDGFVGPKR